VSPPPNDRAESPGERAFRLQLEARTRQIADQLKAQMLPHNGFALLVFDWGHKGNMSYVSNADRATMRPALLEWLARTTEPDDPEDIIMVGLGFARGVAENPPCTCADGTETDRCCYCHAYPSYGDRSKCTHAADCDWIRLRRAFALELPVTLPNGELHTFVGADD
jgi:hypothetical protein